MGLSSAAYAQPSVTAYPSKTLKMVHAFSAGSGTDTCGRILSDGLSKDLQQSIVVENKPGASMMIGTAYAAQQAGDGYTLVMVTLDSLGINPFLYPNITYKAADFDPITLVGQIPLVLVSSTESKLADFTALVKASKAEGKEFAMGTWGHGSVGHVVGVLIAQQTGLKFSYVPFQGAAPAAQAVMGGHVDLSMQTPQIATELIRTGRAKAYAIGGDARVPDLPGVPTFKELGYPSVQAMQWHGMAARAGGNQAIVDKLYASCMTVLRNPDYAKRILQVGYTRIDGRSPAEFGRFIRSESDTWGKIVKTSIPPVTS
jgi:tripartite-type tricarboxylate transporter receptor subunit TctC